MKSDSDLWAEAYGMALGDHKKAVNYYTFLKNQEIQSANQQPKAAKTSPENFPGPTKLTFNGVIVLVSCLLRFAVVAAPIVVILYCLLK